eukprot:CAMPEP_0118663616 /NCGR_PEP_ID=MMETSP0785-20121206/17529_1 /TAXON_ID=91992 /ORGANISM="Bolidomonas pacifica, Strain CCMP 1866" /LENGTH=254 /DNA_ID=CAMNT_0006557377 /DNA_START=1163 /DNA_END=1923 /DNA_ORIENTATION=+
MSTSSTPTTSPTPSTSISIHLLHNSLRLHDNPPLHSIQEHAKTVSHPHYFIPLYILPATTPFSISRTSVTVNKSRSTFLLDSLEGFDEGLREVMDGEGGIVVVEADGKSQAEEDEEEEEEEESDFDDDDSGVEDNFDAINDYSPSDLEVASALKSFLQTSVLPLTSTPSSIKIHYERTPSIPGLRRWRCCLEKAIKPTGVTVQVYDTHNLHSLDKYLTKCKNSSPPSSYGQFCKNSSPPSSYGQFCKNSSPPSS